MLLDFGDKALVPLRLEGRQVVGDVARKQYRSFAGAHQITRVPWRMTRRRQSDDRAIRCDRPTGGESEHRWTGELKNSRNEAARHRSSHDAHQTSREMSHRVPLRFGYPHASRVEFRQPSDVIPVQMREQDPIEVARPVSAASQFLK